MSRFYTLSFRKNNFNILDESHSVKLTLVLLFLTLKYVRTYHFKFIIQFREAVQDVLKPGEDEFHLVRWLRGQLPSFLSTPPMFKHLP